LRRWLDELRIRCAKIPENHSRRSTRTEANGRNVAEGIMTINQSSSVVCLRDLLRQVDVHPTLPKFLELPLSKAYRKSPAVLVTPMLCMILHL
jgi:hypothetical protein